METNRPWNWRLTVPKAIKMTLIRPPHDQYQDDGQSWLCRFCMELPPSVYESSCPLVVRGGESAFGQASALPPHTVADIQNKANFPFHQPGLFAGCWVACSWTPLSVTLASAPISSSSQGPLLPTPQSHFSALSLHLSLRLSCLFVCLFVPCLPSLGPKLQEQGTYLSCSPMCLLIPRCMPDTKTAE